MNKRASASKKGAVKREVRGQRKTDPPSGCQREGDKGMGDEGKTVDKKKVVAITALMIASIAIILVGVALIGFGVMNGISYTVLNSQINAAVFGLLILFLGIRYFMAVRKLKTEVYKTSSKFSWSNF